MYNITTRSSTKKLFKLSLENEFPKKGINTLLTEAIDVRKTGSNKMRYNKLSGIPKLKH